MLEIRNITKSYKISEFKQFALNAVSIKFRKNEFVSILGPSGSGKTTLLNIIGGLDTYDSGDLIINGKSTKKFRDKAWDSYRNSMIGFIFQSYNLISHISVYKNVEMALTLNGVKNKRKKVLDALDKVGLLKHANKKPNQLSGGQMQRVAIARALVNDPEIILADEPTGALDSKISVQIMELIKQIAKDKLVIMVTHNEVLAEKYSSRIIKLKDGNVVGDTNPLDNVKDNKKFKIKKTKMNYLTAVNLSLNNIKTKKGRTILTSFASSIGIIGIALILSISNGFKKQINKYEQNTLSSFPIEISSEASNAYEEQKNDSKSNYEYSKEEFLYSYKKEENLKIHKNNITDNYINYIKKIDSNYLRTISYYRLTNFNIIINNVDNYNEFNNNNATFSELPVDLGDKSYLKENYDLLSGSFPEDETDVVLMVDNKNRIDKSLLEALFVDPNKEKIDFNEVVGKEFKLISNNDYYSNIGNNLFIKKEANKELYDNPNNITLRITGIVRCKKDNALAQIENMMNSMDNTVSKIGYLDKLIEKIVKDNKESDIVKAQKDSEGLVFMGGVSFEQAKITKEQSLLMLGASDTPIKILVYPNDFKNKDKILKYLDKYNEDKEDDAKIIYTDYAREISNLSSSIMDGITIVLVAFSAISLIVSSIMIGIITYISVLERTKEIGILRSLGARKKDITRVFNAETLIIGLLSGLIGILVTRLLLFPVNSILYKLTDLKNIAILNPVHAIILILISTILILIGGFVPALVASKKDPVKALRSE